jgi:hypothetical protein
MRGQQAALIYSAQGEPMYLNVYATNSAREHSKATGPAWTVLAVLCYYANDQWQCEPSIETIAKEARIGRTTVKSALATLEAIGEIAVELRPVPGQKNRPNLYTINLPRPAAARAISKPQRMETASPSRRSSVRANEGTTYETVDKMAYLKERLAA